MMTVQIDIGQLKSVVREAVAEAIRIERSSRKDTMSKREAVRLFASKGKTSAYLEKLIDDGIIRTERASDKQRSRVNIPCEDVYRALGITSYK